VDNHFAKLLEEIFNQVLLAQPREQIGAEPFERTDQRPAHRNGFRDWQMTTRVGTLTLHVPRHGNGEFSTELFEQYQRSEQALVLAMIEMVVNGVSVRKVETITEELCGKKFSKSTVSALCERLGPIVKAFQTRSLEVHYPFVIIDALYLKVRHDYRVQSRALLTAPWASRGFGVRQQEASPCRTLGEKTGSPFPLKKPRLYLPGSEVMIS